MEDREVERLLDDLYKPLIDKHEEEHLALQRRVKQLETENELLRVKLSTLESMLLASHAT